MAQPGTVVGGRYQIVRPIAEGGMGSVHEAIHVLSRRSVALKLLSPDVAREETKRQRFLREVSAPAQIGHDGIVEVYDAGYDEALGVLFVAMELLNGETLRERLARLSPKTVPSDREALLDVFERLLSPVAAAHERGIVHRDLKPENVFLHRRRDGTEVVKVLDFGIARGHDETTPSVTQTGIAMGTPHYMAPEQAMNAREASFPADVWALGVMLYEIISGDVPFPGETAGTILAAAVTEAHRPLAAVALGVDPSLSALVDRCLAKHPSERPPNAHALLEEFLKVRGRATPARPPDVSTAGSSVPSSAVRTTGPISGPATGGSNPSFSGSSGAVSVPLAPSALGSPTPSGPPTAAVVSSGQTWMAGGATGTTSGAPVPGAASPGIAPPGAGSTLLSPGSPASSTDARRRVAIVALAVLGGGGICCLGGAVLWGVGQFGFASTSGSVASAPFSWDGVLEPSDRMLDGKYYDTFSLTARRGDRFVVELVSGEFDPILRLGAPSGAAYENDDFPGLGYGSRIDVPHAEEGTYTVHVTSYLQAAVGRYRVTVRR